jgi:recombination protein U
MIRVAWYFEGRLIMANTERQYQGAVSRAQGKMFEDLIDMACLFYETKGVAVIEKTPEPMRVIKNIGNGQFLAHFEKKAQPDYKGALNNSEGRAIVFEAKHTMSDKISQSRVTKEQAERLDKYEQMGAMCFVIVAFSNKYYRIGWKGWKGMKKLFGRQYIKPEDIERAEIPVKGGIIHFLCDFEPNLRHGRFVLD